MSMGGWIRLKFNGREYTLPELAREAGITSYALRYRLQHGMSVEEAVRQKPRNGQTYTAHGRTMTIKEWAAELHVTVSTLHHRMAHMPIEQALSPITRRGNNRRARTVTAWGRTQSVRAWAKEVGIRPDSLYRRLQDVDDPEIALLPVEEYQRVRQQKRKAENAAANAQADGAKASHVKQAREIIGRFAFPSTRMPIRRALTDMATGDVVLEGDGGGDIMYRVTLRRNRHNEVVGILRTNGSVICRRECMGTTVLQADALGMVRGVRA